MQWSKVFSIAIMAGIFVTVVWNILMPEISLKEFLLGDGDYSDEDFDSNFYLSWDETYRSMALHKYALGRFDQAIYIFEQCSEEEKDPVCKYYESEWSLIDNWTDEEAMERLKYLATNEGNPDAQYLYACMLSNQFEDVRKYTSDTYPWSLLHLYAASTAHHPGALMAMGYRHWKGYGVPKRCETAALNYLEVAKSVAKIYSSTIPRAVELVRLHVPSDKSSLSLSEISLYTEVAKVNADLAQAVGKRFLLGSDGFPQDFEQAFKFLKLSADTGKNPGALALMGYMWALGLGQTEPDMALAEKFFTLGQKDGLGMNGLGYVRFQEGNHAEAFQWFNKSATAGSADGMFNLGSLYLTGTGIAQSFQLAFMWFTEALRRGHTPAGYALAVMHLNGIGTVRDCEMAVSLLKEVAERGEWVANNLRASQTLLADGDAVLAALVMLKLAEAGHLVSQENLAQLMIQGKTGQIYKDQTKYEFSTIYAQRFYEMAADQGSISSAIKIGDYSYNGMGIEPKLTESDQGDEVTLSYMSKVPNYASAQTWYVKARDSAVKILDLATSASPSAGGGSIVSVAWLEQVLGLAEYNLGFMHHFGIGAVKNNRLAAEHYRNAIPKESHGKFIFHWIIDTFIDDSADFGGGIDEESEYTEEELDSFSESSESAATESPPPVKSVDSRLIMLSTALGILIGLLVFRFRLVLLGRL